MHEIIGNNRVFCAQQLPIATRRHAACIAARTLRFLFLQSNLFWCARRGAAHVTHTCLSRCARDCGRKPLFACAIVARSTRAARSHRTVGGRTLCFERRATSLCIGSVPVRVASSTYMGLSLCKRLYAATHASLRCAAASGPPDRRLTISDTHF